MKKLILILSIVYATSMCHAENNSRMVEANLHIDNPSVVRTNVTMYVAGPSLDPAVDKLTSSLNMRMEYWNKEIKSQYDDHAKLFNWHLSITTLIVTVLGIVLPIISAINSKKREGQIRKDYYLKIRQIRKCESGIIELRNSLEKDRKLWQQDKDNAVGLLYFQSAKSRAAIARMIPISDLKNKIRAYSDAVRMITRAIEADVKGSSIEAVGCCIRFLHSIDTQLEGIENTKGKEVYINTYIRSWQWPISKQNIERYINDNASLQDNQKTHNIIGTLNKVYKKYWNDEDS